MPNALDMLTNLEQNVSNATNNTNQLPNVSMQVSGIVTLTCPALSFEVTSIKKWLDKPVSLSRHDISRYHTLISAYKHISANPFPDWKLTDKNQPTFFIDRPLLIQELKDNIRTLTSKNTSLHLSRASILSLILKYIEACDSRSWLADHLYDAYDRPNGIESMVIIEMIKWMLHIVPNLSHDNQQTIDEFASRIKYCKEIPVKLTKSYTQVQERTNFEDLMKELTTEFEQYHAHLIKSYEAANFNKLIEKLSEHLLGTISQTFSSMSLLIKYVDQPHLIVRQFIDPPSSNKPIIAMRNTKLGEWLLDSLKFAGIKNSTYEPNNALTLDGINNHLNGQHPNDGENCILSEKLKNPLHPKWGHWDFVTTPISLPASRVFTHKLFQRGDVNKNLALKVNAENYLTAIRDLYRITLKICFIRENLIRAALVSSVFGEDWIYGDKVGSAVLDSLLDGTVTEIINHQNVFNTFWNNYFNNNFIVYETLTKQDSSEYPSHNWLHIINLEKKESLETTKKSIIQLIDSIKKQKNKLPESKEKIKKIKISMYTDVLSILDSQGKNQSPEYHTIHQELNNLKIEQNLHAVLGTEELQKIENVLISKIKNRLYDEANNNWLSKQVSEIQNGTSNQNSQDTNELNQNNISKNIDISQNSGSISIEEDNLKHLIDTVANQVLTDNKLIINSLFKEKTKNTNNNIQLSGSSSNSSSTLSLGEIV